MTGGRAAARDIAWTTSLTLTCPLSAKRAARDSGRAPHFGLLYEYTAGR
jgi:hypothetical protein